MFPWLFKGKKGQNEFEDRVINRRVEFFEITVFGVLVIMERKP